VTSRQKNVACTCGQSCPLPASNLDSKRRIKNLKEGGIAPFKIITKRYAILIVQGELHLQVNLFDEKINDLRQVVGEEIQMCQLADHV